MIQTDEEGFGVGISVGEKWLVFSCRTNENDFRTICVAIEVRSVVCGERLVLLSLVVIRTQYDQYMYAYQFVSARGVRIVKLNRLCRSSYEVSFVWMFRHLFH